LRRFVVAGPDLRRADDVVPGAHPGATDEGARRGAADEGPRIAGVVLAYGSATTPTALSADGSLLATATASRAALVIGTKNGEQVATTPPLGASARALAFASDGRALFVVNDAGEVLRWAVGSAVVTPLGTVQSEPLALAISPDGAHLAVATSSAIEIVDTATRGLARTLPGARSGGRTLAFSPDGRWLAATSDGLLELFASPRFEIAATVRFTPRYRGTWVETPARPGAGREPFIDWTGDARQLVSCRVRTRRVPNRLCEIGARSADLLTHLLAGDALSHD
jgi:WD40 repeat protein